jgi:hypothetical protein
MIATHLFEMAREPVLSFRLQTEVRRLAPDACALELFDKYST